MRCKRLVYWTCFLGWLSALGAGGLSAQELSWRPYEGPPLLLENKISLPQTLQRLLQEHAENPRPLRIDSQLPENLPPRRREASSPELLFDLLLREQGLTLLQKNLEWWILDDRDVWRQRPFRRLLPEPLPLVTLLNELALWGRVSLQYPAGEPPQTLRVSENLDFTSVADGFTQLAARFDAEWQYDAERHLIRWQPLISEEVRALSLMQAPATELIQFVRQLPAAVRDPVQVQVSSPRLLLLQGSPQALQRLEPLLRQFDQAWQAPAPAEPDSTEAALPVVSAPPVEIEPTVPEVVPPTTEVLVLQSLEDSVLERQLLRLRTGPSILQEVEAFWESGQRPTLLWLQGPAQGVLLLREALEQLEQVSAVHSEESSVPESLPSVSEESRLQRFELHYLPVGRRRMVAEGQSIELPGAEEQLREFLENDPDFWNQDTTPLILPDRRNNTLLVRGTTSQLQWIEELLTLWDQPSPLIRIEAHIFETTEETSRELGLRWRGTGVSAEGVLAQEAPDFGLSWTAGPLDTSRGMKVDALLRLLQQRGQGRVLSRPVVVTLNGVEAEMNSGSLLNIRLVNESSVQLRQLQTGVTLRVTPRWIEAQDAASEGQVEVSIFAETSTPLADAVDGIPQINSQKGRSSLTVPNGQPILLGGMIRQRNNSTRQGLPWLQDLPVLGPLFGLRSEEQGFDHVLVFVTPTRMTEIMPMSLPELPELTPERAETLLNPRP